MAFAATLNIMDAGTPAGPTAPALPTPPAVDWADEYPEDQFVQLAAKWRVIVVGTAAVASWVAIGGAVLTIASRFGAI